MAASTLEDLMRRAEALTADEKLRLAAYLVDQAREIYSKACHSRRWEDLCGMAPGLLAGEDAQEWVSRTRRESDELRDHPRKQV